MNPEQKTFHSLTDRPGRLNPEQAGWLLGFSSTEIAILISAGLLPVLGNPSPQARKFILTKRCLELRDDERWMSRATREISKYWADKNASRKNGKQTPSSSSSQDSGDDSSAGQEGEKVRRLRRPPVAA